VIVFLKPQRESLALFLENDLLLETWEESFTHGFKQELDFSRGGPSQSLEWMREMLASLRLACCLCFISKQVSARDFNKEIWNHRNVH